MKQKVKCKVISLMLGFFFILSISINVNNSIDNGMQSAETDQLDKTLKLSTPHAQIYIKNNWSDAKIAGICTGSGSFSDPYKIQNYEITGWNDYGIKITDSEEYFIISGCTLDGELNDGQYGIRLTNVTNGRIMNNVCSNRYYTGIYAYLCNNNTFSGNVANGFYTHGFHFIDSHNNTLVGNTANSGQNEGLFLTNGNDNNISQNNFNYNTDNGVFIGGDYNIIEKNNVLYSSYIGMQITGDFSNISSNTVRYSFYDKGISMYGDNNIISGNIVSDNEEGGGIYLSGIKNIISGNTVKDNKKGSGIRVTGYNNSIISNTATGNVGPSGDDSDITLFNGDGNKVLNNNVGGIYIDNYTRSEILENILTGRMIITKSLNNDIIKNTITVDSGDFALTISLSHSNNILENTISGYRKGLGLFYCDNNIIRQNTINNHVDIGLYLDHSNYNTIKDNELIGNTYGCIEEVDCVGNIFENNNCGEEEFPIIYGYNIFFLISAIAVVSMILVKKRLD